MQVYSPLLEWITNMRFFTGLRMSVIGMKPQLFCIKVRIRPPLHIRLLMCISFGVEILLISRRNISRLMRMELTLWRSTPEVMTEMVQEVILEHSWKSVKSGFLVVRL